MHTLRFFFSFKYLRHTGPVNVCYHVLMMKAKAVFSNALISGKSCLCKSLMDISKNGG